MLVNEESRRRRYEPQSREGVSPLGLKAVYLEICRRVDHNCGPVRLDIPDLLDVLCMTRVTLWRSLGWLERNGVIYREHCPLRGKLIGPLN